MDMLLHILANVLVPLFFVGLLGSAVVVFISFIEDLTELIGEEE